VLPIGDIPPPQADERDYAMLDEASEPWRRH